MVSIDSTTRITVRNSTGSSIVAAAGTRLILHSDPVTVYADAGGSTPVAGGNSIDVDPASPPVVWIARPAFDYATVASTIAVDAVSAVQTLTGNGPTKSWSHTAGGSHRLVLVAVSWQDSLGEESISSVTYDGAAMILLESSSFGAVYSLRNPPTGSKTVVVTWSGSNPKGAVAASISYTGVTMASNIASVSSATGSSTSPSLNVPTNSDQGQVFALLSVQSATSTVTLTPGAGLIPRWSSSAGASGSATLTQGAGATRDSTGVSATMGWTLSASRMWSVIGVVLKPQSSVTLGVPGGVTVGSHSVDARNYASLQAAVDDVAVGGTLMIPNGDYSVPSGGLIVRKPMTIQGEIGTNLYAYSPPPTSPSSRSFPGERFWSASCCATSRCRTRRCPCRRSRGTTGCCATFRATAARSGT